MRPAAGTGTERLTNSKNNLSIKMCYVKACIFQCRIKREKEVENLEEIINQDKMQIQVFANKTNE